MRQKILHCCSRKNTKCANNVTAINCHDVSWWCSIYTHVDIYQIEDFDPTYIQIADRGSHVIFMNYEGALTTMTKALTSRPQQQRSDTKALGSEIWRVGPGIWDLKRKRSEEGGDMSTMLKSLGLDMPAKAKEQNGQDAVGEFDIEKFYTFQFFTPKKIHSKAWVIKLALPFQCWLNQTKPMQNWREFQFHPLLFNNSRGQHFGNLQGFPNKRHYFPPVQNS